MSFDLTNKPIETTFHNLLQRTGSGRLYDLKGLEITDLRINGTLFADQYVVSSSVTEVKFQRRSGSTISGDTQDDIHQFTGSLDITGSITSSGNISSSGYVYGDRIYVNEKILGDYTSDTLRVGFDDGVTALSYGKQSIPHYFEGNITASGNISSSGTITAEQLTTSDDLTVGDDIIMSDGGRIKDVAGNDDYIIFDQSNRRIDTNIDGGRILSVGNGIVGINTTPVTNMQLTVHGHISASGDYYVEDSNIIYVTKFGRVDAGGEPYVAVTNNFDVSIGDSQGAGNETIFAVDDTNQKITTNRPLAVNTTIPATNMELTVAGDISASGDLNLTNITASGNMSASLGSTGSLGLLQLEGDDFTSASLASAIAGGGGAVDSISNGADNRVVTFSDSDSLNGEENLTFDGNNLSVTGAITASGNISSSGRVYGSRLYVEDLAIAKTAAGGISLGDKNIELVGQISASGDISSSGTITANQYGGNVSGSLVSTGSFGYFIGDGGGLTNVSATPSAGTISSSTQVFTALTSSGDISASGGVTASSLFIDNSIYHHGDEDTKITFADNVVRVNAGDIVNTNFYSYGTHFSLPITASGNISSSGDISANQLQNITRLTFDTTEYIDSLPGGIVTSGDISASGNLSASGDVYASQYYVEGESALFVSSGKGFLFSDTQVTKLQIGKGGVPTETTINGAITASDNISSSGHIYGDRIHSNGKIAATSPSTDKLRIGYDSGLDFIEYGKDTNTSHYFYGNAITSSGNISASGIIYGNEISSSGAIFAKGTNLDFVVSASTSTELRVDGDISASGGYFGDRGYETGSVTAVGNTTGGDIVYFGQNSGLTAGTLYYLNTGGTWTAADASDNTTGADELLGIALGANALTDGVLLRGVVNVTGISSLTNIGRALYISTTAGDVTETAPSSNNNIVRVVGYVTNANDTMYFNPSAVWVKVSA